VREREKVGGRGREGEREGGREGGREERRERGREGEGEGGREKERPCARVRMRKGEKRRQRESVRISVLACDTHTHTHTHTHTLEIVDDLRCLYVEQSLNMECWDNSYVISRLPKYIGLLEPY